MADTGLKTNFSAPRRLPDVVDHLVTAAEAAFIDVPFAALKRMVGVADDREVYAAGWKAYDALVNSASEAINRLYTNERYLRFAGRTLDITLGVYRLNTAVAGAFFATLWPAIGIPAAADIEALREELHSLREENNAVRAAAAEERVERATAATRPADGVLARPAWERERWTVSNGEQVKASVGN